MLMINRWEKFTSLPPAIWLQESDIFLNTTAQATPPARNSAAPMLFMSRRNRVEIAEAKLETSIETMLSMAKRIP